jgi:hypothetical protein
MSRLTQRFRGNCSVGFRIVGGWSNLHVCSSLTFMRKHFNFTQLQSVPHLPHIQVLKQFKSSEEPQADYSGRAV